MPGEYSDGRQQQLSLKYGVEFFPSEVLEYDSICLLPQMTATDYANRVIEAQCQWRQLQNKRPKVFTRIVDENFNTLIERGPAEDVSSAQSVLVDYGVKLRDKLHATPHWAINEEYLTWITKIRKLANFTNLKHNERSDTIHYSRAPEHDEGSFSSVQFWQEVYLKTMDSKIGVNAITNYVFGPNIESKDPAILLDIIERMQEEGIEELFADSVLINRKPQKLILTAYDVFRTVIKEASEAGWVNATVVHNLFQDAPKRDVPLHAVIIEVGNVISRAFERKGIEPENIHTGKLSLYDIENAPVAINRCLRLMFEFGQQPTGHDPLNYILTGQIIGALCADANRLLREMS